VPKIPGTVRAIFFDAVGTLLFPEPPAPVIYAQTARRHGLDLTPSEVRVRFLGAYRAEEEADASTAWATSETRERKRWRRIVTETLAGVSDTDACYRALFDHFAQPSAWQLAADATEVLSALHHRGLVLGLGSNYDQRLWSVLAGFPELDPLRPRVLISASVGVRKPGAGFFNEAARSAGCELAQVLFVGDDYDNDYAGATAAGLPAVLLDPHARYADVPHRITRLAELLDS
jgi:putative hydrolase of the HAD superfamily